MLSVLRARWGQGYRTMDWPDGPAPAMPDRFAGRPIVAGPCPGDPQSQAGAGGGAGGCDACVQACPTGAVSAVQGGGVQVDSGRCLFCRACEQACPNGTIRFGAEYRLASARREDLLVGAGSPPISPALVERARDLFGRSLKLRQVSAGGCNACEADCNVLGTPAWDMGRFGLQFVASPRHADGLLITGPVTGNMRLALLKTWEATPAPRLVIAVGACAISGGPYVGHPEAHDGAGGLLPVDLFVPGCPPHPLTILDGLLRLIGRVADVGA